MKNYIAFYVIIAVFVFVFAFNYTYVNNIKYELLNTAVKLEKEIINQDDINDTYKSFEKTLKQSKYVLNTVINNSKYNDIEKCAAEIAINFKFGDRKSLQINAKKLVFLINDIIDEEKCVIHNIL